MAVLRLRYYGDPILQKTAKRVTVFDQRLKDLAADMIETVRQEDGIGLAAPQVGSSIRLIVVSASRTPVDFQVLVNPEIVESQGRIVAEEGCLSVPDVRSKVERFEKVKVKAQDLDARCTEVDAEGLHARVVQHELDHLDGLLFVQRLSRAKLFLLKGALEEIRKKSSESSGAGKGP